MIKNISYLIDKYRKDIDSFKSDALKFEVEEKELSDWQQYFNGWPCAKHQGFHLEFLDDRIAMVCIPEVKPEHLGGKGEHAVNGATISGILDCAVSVAGFMHYKGKTCGTISSSIHMKRPLYGNYILCLGKITKRSKNLCFGESAIFNENSVVCANNDSIVAVSSRYSDAV
ncbi:MAG: hypothetical protein VB958_04340 [Thalassolituus sp.]|uniref:hypothetical protein n=1 Tax=Thalassolituus sp. TaxID=2030822 RepID=UPI0039822680